VTGGRHPARAAAAAIVDGAFAGLSRLGRLAPQARPAHHGVELSRNVAYRSEGDPAHRLDIYTPEGPGPHPVIFYVHGGGFRALSKETHWVMGLGFARSGFLVFSIDYRLAPEAPYPAGLSDVCAAYTWVVDACERYGGDANRLVVAGESAGANLVTSLVLCASYKREEAWAQSVYEVGVVPRAAIPACGILQVSDSVRFRRDRKLNPFFAFVIEDTEDCYVRPAAGAAPLADPLLVLERGVEPQRPLPPFFIPVGGGDPLAWDSERLGVALERLGVQGDVRIYPRELHAFHALVWRSAARQCWRDMTDFARVHTEPRGHSGDKAPRQSVDSEVDA